MSRRFTPQRVSALPPIGLGIAFALWLAGACGCGSSAPPPREYPRLDAPADASADSSRETLRERPTVVAQRGDSPIVSLRVVFDAGSAEDPAGREGLTHVTAHVMAEDGAGELSYPEVLARLFPMAAAIEVRVDRDQTVFVGEVHRDHLEDFYSVFRDVLTRPQMSEGAFARVRSQTLSLLSDDLRVPDNEALAREVLQEMLYAEHPFSHPSLGTIQALGRITIDDVRAHRARVFCAGRAFVGIAGAFPEGFTERIEEDLGRLQTDACVGRLRLPEVTAHGPTVRIVQHPGSQRVVVAMGLAHSVPREHPDYPALVLAAAWLGQPGQMVGRLPLAIRKDRGLNYGDYAYAEHFARLDRAPYPLTNNARRQQYFSVWMSPIEADNTNFAVRLAVRMIRRLVQEGLTEAELDEIRGFAQNYYALYAQTPSRRLGFAIDDAFHGVQDAYLHRLRSGWERLTAAELNAALRRHLDPSALRIAVVAPNAEDLADALAADAPASVRYPEPPTEEIRAEDAEIAGYQLGIARGDIEVVAVDTLFTH